jgi:hypothetical protein
MMPKPISGRAGSHGKNALCAPQEYQASSAIDVAAINVTVILDDPPFDLLIGCWKGSSQKRRFERLGLSSWV